MMKQQVCIIGGSPRMPIDAVRYVTARSSGDTARQLCELLTQRGAACTLILNEAHGDRRVTTYQTRAELENCIQRHIDVQPQQCFIMSAAVNDFEPSALQVQYDGVLHTVAVAESKVSSTAEAFEVRFERSSKLIDRFATMGHTGHLVAFKFEHKDSVVASAQSLCRRVGARWVLANSLCMSLQVLITRLDDGFDLDSESGPLQTVYYASRQEVLQALADAITAV